MNQNQLQTDTKHIYYADHTVLRHNEKFIIIKCIDISENYQKRGLNSKNSRLQFYLIHENSPQSNNENLKHLGKRNLPQHKTKENPNTLKMNIEEETPGVKCDYMANEISKFKNMPTNLGD